jgi:Golgi apparatus protein 1
MLTGCVYDDDCAVQFCKDVEPGNARTKQCLEEHREELTNACREEIDSVIERRVRDFRLDSKLRDACEAEIANMCAYFGVSCCMLG